MGNSVIRHVEHQETQLLLLLEDALFSPELLNRVGTGRTSNLQLLQSEDGEELDAADLRRGAENRRTVRRHPDAAGGASGAAASNGADPSEASRLLATLSSLARWARARFDPDTAEFELLLRRRCHALAILARALRRRARRRRAQRQSCQEASTIAAEGVLEGGAGVGHGRPAPLPPRTQVTQAGVGRAAIPLPPAAAACIRCFSGLGLALMEQARGAQPAAYLATIRLIRDELATGPDAAPLAFVEGPGMPTEAAAALDSVCAFLAAELHDDRAEDGGGRSDAHEKEGAAVRDRHRSSIQAAASHALVGLALARGSVQYLLAAAQALLRQPLESPAMGPTRAQRLSADMRDGQSGAVADTATSRSPAYPGSLDNRPAMNSVSNDSSTTGINRTTGNKTLGGSLSQLVALLTALPAHTAVRDGAAESNTLGHTTHVGATRLICAGQNRYGELMIGESEPGLSDRHNFVAAGLPGRWQGGGDVDGQGGPLDRGDLCVQVAAGNEVSALLTATGDLYTAGLNFMGQCGRGSAEKVLPFGPVEVFHGTTSRVAHVEMAHGCEQLFIVTTSGELWACGDNSKALDD